MHLTVHEWPDQEERKRDPLSCTYGKLQCDLDVPVLGGAFAVASARAQELVARSRCKRVAYTAYFGTTANIALFLPPYGSEGCAFVFIHPGTAVSQDNDVRQWTPIEVDTGALPWPAWQGRRNSRVPKLLPHLFFPYPATEVTVYIDAEDDLSYANIDEMISSTISECNTSFAAQAHPDRAQNVMEEFSAIREAHKSAEPETLDAQEATYRNDTAFMNAVNAGLGRMLDGALLVRKTDDVDAKHLSENWMRAYLRGADRDQPAFAYALEKSTTGPCRDWRGECDVDCASSGFLNLFSHSQSNLCRRGGPASPSWSSPPPQWVCNGTINRVKNRRAPFTAVRAAALLL